MSGAGAFAEWAEVHGQRYGTSWREIRAKSGKGRTLVLDIDIQGARSIKRQFPGGHGHFRDSPHPGRAEKTAAPARDGTGARKRERGWPPP